MEKRNIWVIILLALFTISASTVRDVIIYQPKTPRVSFIEIYSNDVNSEGKVKDKYKDLSRAGWQEIEISVARGGSSYNIAYTTYVITAVKY